ncbi:hypothetical protein BWZ20_00230 [Winogradskyella sp. J14-2]|uniref:hypothetical protein n=1 Tax=Winogradskyella sp. J14-2 TaxID=1936080 RepID=UPI000972996D|nr:hypothetical protein [Winogradskyella sp. J14-2]APY06815.1 hypothetical protein BWZ20_00230 [Winogradskyella sp. J14-2]
MNFDLEDKLNEYVKRNDLDSAIKIAESELSKIPETEFHQLIGMNLLHLESELSEFISKFYSSVKLKYTFSFSKKLKAFYCEMNGFTINYDRWFIDLFSFSEIGNEDYEWLADFEHHTNKDLTIIGFENLQKVYEDVYRNQKFDIPEIEQAYEVSELLIILRLQELFRETYKKAKESEKKWSNYPMFVTAHDYEMIYKIN